MHLALAGTHPLISAIVIVILDIVIVIVTVTVIVAAF